MTAIRLSRPGFCRGFFMADRIAARLKAVPGVGIGRCP
jgi:hypothetical protein